MLLNREQKRKIIGETFIRVFEEAASSVGDASFLVQGTLYPDVIESGSGTAATIKTHHNVGGLPEDMTLELVEPLAIFLRMRYGLSVKNSAYRRKSSGASPSPVRAWR